MRLANCPNLLVIQRRTKTVYALYASHTSIVLSTMPIARMSITLKHSISMKSRLCNACEKWNPVDNWDWGCPDCGHTNGRGGESTLLLMPDLPGYQSPVTGLWVEGRRARREDLKRTGSRPYEGLAQEQKEAARQRQYHEQKLDASLTTAASEAFYQLPPQKRRILEGR